MIGYKELHQEVNSILALVEITTLSMMYHRTHRISNSAYTLYRPAEVLRLKFWPLLGIRLKFWPLLRIRLKFWLWQRIRLNFDWGSAPTENSTEVLGPNTQNYHICRTKWGTIRQIRSYVSFEYPVICCRSWQHYTSWQQQHWLTAMITVWQQHWLSFALDNNSVGTSWQKQQWWQHGNAVVAPDNTAALHGRGEQTHAAICLNNAYMYIGWGLEEQRR